jgi:hypothetical protein
MVDYSRIKPISCDGVLKHAHLYAICGISSLGRRRKSCVHVDMAILPEIGINFDVITLNVPSSASKVN